MKNGPKKDQFPGLKVGFWWPKNGCLGGFQPKSTNDNLADRIVPGKGRFGQSNCQKLSFLILCHVLEGVLNRVDFSGE